MEVNHNKPQKLIVNFPPENLEKLCLAAEKENRTRNNFVITAALEKANLILNKSSVVTE